MCSYVVGHERPPTASEQRHKAVRALRFTGKGTNSLLCWKCGPYHPEAREKLRISGFSSELLNQNLHFIKTPKQSVCTLNSEKQWVSKLLLHPGET